MARVQMVACHGNGGAQEWIHTKQGNGSSVIIQKQVHHISDQETHFGSKLEITSTATPNLIIELSLAGCRDG